MKKDLPLTSESLVSKHAHLFGVSPFRRLRQGTKLSAEKLSDFFTQIQNKLNEGLSQDTAEICFEILETYSNPIDVQVRINQQIAIAFQMEGRFEDALEILKPFEDREIAAELDPESLANVYVLQASSYAYLNEPDKAIDRLNSASKIAEEREVSELLVTIHLVFARVYREQNEYPVSRNYAEKALKRAREIGDWRSAAEAFRIIAAGYHREGNSQRALEFLNQSIRFIGDRSAPFLLGRIHSDFSAVHSALFQPQEGVESLRKAIKLFDEIGQKFHLAVAYNNFASNLLLSGDWEKAEEFLHKAVDLALEVNHSDLAAIVCSVGELNLLRDNLGEAEKLFKQSLALAEENKKQWYAVRISYNLARCLLAQNKTTYAIKRAVETIGRSDRISERHYRIRTQLVLAESLFQQRKIPEAEEVLNDVEQNGTSTDFFVQGSAARLRGLIETANNDETLAIQHFSRSLSMFETAGDFYQTALTNLELGKSESNRQPTKARLHLTAAYTSFVQIGLTKKVKLAEARLAELSESGPSPLEVPSTNAHLLMLRLVEAVSSRELLFRELAAIIKQETKSQKMILAETKGGRNFIPSIFEGFTSSESLEMTAKMNEARNRNVLDDFGKEKNLSIFELHAPNVSSAILMIAPAKGGELADGSSIRPLLRVVELCMEVCALREHGAGIQHPSKSDSSPLALQNLMPEFIHSSPAMNELVNEIQKIRTSDVTTLITGESGTGKELVAKAIHLVSKRSKKVFIPFNCTAVPRELTEGHLFGYRKGSFTGAVNDSVGVIRAAEGGTLFLDEIGDLPLDIQPKILRFLQEGEVQPLGEKAPKQVDVRIIAATNMNLEEKVAQGLFREDLYYRLNVIRLSVPPLRDRRSEIPLLIDHYINYYSEKFGRRDLTMSSEAMDLLISYNWQGNVRQLCNEVQRIVARSENGDKISPLHLSPEIKPSADSTNTSITGNVRATGFGSAISIHTHGGTLEEAVTALEIQLITDSLKRNNSNISKVARELGLTRRGLYMKLDRYKLRNS